MPASDEHSSLFGSFVNYEKKFCEITAQLGSFCSLEHWKKYFLTNLSNKEKVCVCVCVRERERERERDREKERE
jgi:hypothetical protein